MSELYDASNELEATTVSNQAERIALLVPSGENSITEAEHRQVDSLIVELSAHLQDLQQIERTLRGNLEEHRL